MHHLATSMLAPGLHTIPAHLDDAIASAEMGMITDPDELPRWWGQDGLYRTEKHDADLREGGTYKSSGRGADGAEFSVNANEIEAGMELWTANAEGQPTMKGTAVW